MDLRITGSNPGIARHREKAAGFQFFLNRTKTCEGSISFRRKTFARKTPSRRSMKGAGVLLKCRNAFSILLTEAEHTTVSIGHHVSQMSVGRVAFAQKTCSHRNATKNESFLKKILLPLDFDKTGKAFSFAPAFTFSLSFSTSSSE